MMSGLLVCKEGQPVDTKKQSTRFPLRLPEDLDAEIRTLAQGKGDRPPSGINDTIVLLLREALKSRREKQEPQPGNRTPVLLAA